MKAHPLKVERELRGWSQAKVAEAVETNVRTVIRWEQGQTIPYPYFRERLCALFGKNARELGLLVDTAGDVDADAREVEQDKQPTIPTSDTSRNDQIPPVPEAFWKVPSVFMPLIGRSQEIDEIKALLTTADARLVTLTGTGGIGKTRLSIQLAHESWSLFPDGICFIALATVNDPAQVMPVISRELDLSDESIPPPERVQKFLHAKHMLLVLDNFEQVAQAAPQLEQLLGTCPRVKMLVTSRVVLHISSEHQYRLPPLAIPAVKKLPDSAAIAQYAAVELFVQRARTIIPTFQVTESNAVALAKICARLDGIPLAIELAAARVKLLPPHVLLPRLSRSLQVLTKGLTTLPERQQTLRSTISWSYDLLDAGEQRLFRLLSIFVGGFTLETAESFFASVAKTNENSLTNALDGLDSLIDKSLLQPSGLMDEPGEPRLEMLETIREYGRERLLEYGEMEFARQAHAECYLQFAEQAARELPDQQQALWLERLDHEYGNLQAAMEWTLTSESTTSLHIEQKISSRQEMALRLGNALSPLWLSRGYLSEGWRFAERALKAYQGEKATPALAHAYVLASQLIMRLGSFDRAEALLEQGIKSYRELRDDIHVADAQRVLGWIEHQKNEHARAYDLYEQSLAIFKQLDDRRGIANTLLNMAFVVQTQGDYERARLLLEEVVTRQRALGNKTGIINALYQLAQVLFGAREHPPFNRIRSLLAEGLHLAEEMGDRRGTASMQGLAGWVAYAQGNLSEGRRLVEDCLRFYKEGGDRQITGQYLVTLGGIILAQGDYAAARSLFEESMAVGKEMGDRNETVAAALEGMADLAIAQGNHPWAVQLWAVAARWREEIQMPIMPGQRIIHDRALQQVRLLLGEKTFTVLWEEGRTLSPEEVWFASNISLSTRETCK